MQIQSTSEIEYSASKDKTKKLKNLKIITVAIVIIIVMAAIYVYIDEGSNNGSFNAQPLGIGILGRTETTIRMGISRGSVDALVRGSEFSFIRNNTVISIDNITVYTPAGLVAAWYTPSGGWEYIDTDTANTLAFEVGVQIIVTVNAGVASGDKLIVSSSEGYFGRTTVTNP